MTHISLIQEEKKNEELLTYLTGRNSKDQFPKAITLAGQGGKFSPDGKVLSFPGNTFICHLDPNSRAFAAMSVIQDVMMASEFAKYFTFMPKSSFHMTVFCGVSGNPLGSDGWPSGFAAGTSLSEFTTAFSNNLKDFNYSGHAQVQTVSLRAGYSLRLRPSTDQYEKSLRGARDQLRDATGLYRQDHKTYEFHSTLAYPISWIPEDKAKALIEFSNALFDTHKHNLKSIDLGPIEFCEFDDMHAFRALALFGKDCCTQTVSGVTE